jgi:hypothetical protein
MQPYPAVAADALLEIGTAVISAVLSLDDHLSQIIHFADTILSKISAAIAIVFLQRCGAFSSVNTVRHQTCFLSQTLPVSQRFDTSRCIVVLFGTSLPGYALLNASRTAANDFDAM